MAAGAAAVALPGALIGKEAAAPKAAFSGVKAAGVAAAKRRRITMPVEVSYGGWRPDGREVRLEHTLTPAGQVAPSYPDGWREGTTIPAKYYVDEDQYRNDEQFIAENFWIMADHASRIPNSGDYFVFEFGLRDSVIIVRDRAGDVKAYHNVCRHRGSRLCMHGTDFDNIRPSEALPDGKPADPRMSTVQLGSTGNSPVFRCVYHAWTYDLEGKLVSFPAGMPADFDPADHGLHSAHVRIVNGFIYVSFALAEPSDFESFTASWKAVTDEFQTADLKVVARKSYPTKANWKIVLENFRECYHCLPAHAKSFTETHLLFPPNITPEQRTQIEQELELHGHPIRQPGAQPGMGAAPQYQERARPRPDSSAFGQHLPVGYLTGTFDGKYVAPILPAKRSEPASHARKSATTGFTTAWIACYDDHVAVIRFTPRSVELTDAEVFFLVAGDAREQDVDIDRMIAVWDVTYREDRWINENNHHGIKNSRYNRLGGQPYSATEGGPASLAKWYMTEIAPLSGRTPTDAA